MTMAYIALGSNIDAARNLQAAVERLRGICNILALSSVYQTPPFGYLNQPDFLNVTVKAAVTGEPADFKRQLYAIEDASGRVRAHQETRWGPLELDCDLLLWGDMPLTFGDKPWHVPNEGILEYAAVAAPLAEIAPSASHPVTGETFAAIAGRLGNEGILTRPDIIIR